MSTYIKQLEKQKFVETMSGHTAVLIKPVAAGAGGINQHSRYDREKAKFTTVNGKVAVKVVLTT